MPSAEYHALECAVADLKSGLMDFAPSPIEPYTDSDLLKCQAFVIFSHAEMQVYWESVARRILSEAEKRWNSNSAVDRVIATLIAFRRPDNVSIPENPGAPHAGGSFKILVEKAIKTQNDVVSANNGIKRANLSELLIPLGVLPENFDETLLILSDQTGKRRGDMVHKSTKVSLRNIRDPFADEMNDIDQLLVEISKFDTLLETLGLLAVPENP